MSGRKSKPSGMLVMLLILALLTVGVGYTLWSKTLTIDGTVATGFVDSIFVDPFTDDPPGSDDPGYIKDVGECLVEFGADPETLIVTVNDAYPSYYCTVFFGIYNNGSIPVKIINLAAMGPHITASWTDLDIGQQIDPGDTVPGDLHLHVEQSAPQGGTLTLYGKIQLAQWNEATTLAWQTCSATATEPCWDAPEVSFAGNTVIMGVLGEGDFTQNRSVHGGSALLPDGSSYDVTFQYHICTWDSYNAPGTPGYAGTGWWDSFSVSTSTALYWDLGLTDPVSLPFVWGGNDFADDILECNDGTQTLNMAGNPAGPNYLNVVLDSGTLDHSNHAHPSYGTITIEEIVVHP